MMRLKKILLAVIFVLMFTASLPIGATAHGRWRHRRAAVVYGYQNRPYVVYRRSPYHSTYTYRNHYYPNSYYSTYYPYNYYNAYSYYPYGYYNTYTYSTPYQFGSYYPRHRSRFRIWIR